MFAPLNGPLGSAHPLSTGSGSTPGTLATYTSMTALAAALTDVGMCAALVNATSGNVILRALRVQAGANGLLPLGIIRLYEAAGTEFDGAFSPASVNGVGTISWGTPGSRSTGGISVTAGTVIFPGWVQGRGTYRATRGVFYVSALPGAPAAADVLAACCLPAASTTTDLYGGGIAYNGTSYRAAGIANGAPNGPGIGYGSALVSTPTVPDYFECSSAWTKTSNAADSAAGSAAFVTKHPNVSGTPYTLGSTTNLDSSNNTWQLAFTMVGGWTAKLIELWHVMRWEALA